jgi:RHS repeat-associated protein
VWRAAYEAFGKAVVDEDPDANSSAVKLNLRFPGQYFDAESGLHYNRFRTYDPATGRYLEADPIGQAGGVNLYPYAFSDPIDHMDPLGLEGISFTGLDDPELDRILRENGYGWALGDPSAPGSFCAIGSGPPREGDEGNGVSSAIGDAVVDYVAGLFSGVKPGDSSPEATAKVKAARDAAKSAANRAASRAKGIPDSQIGPSGLPKRHTVEHTTRKEAREAATRETPPGGRVRNDANPADPRQGPHFQAEDAQGRNERPVVHHEYPE